MQEKIRAKSSKVILFPDIFSILRSTPNISLKPKPIDNRFKSVFKVSSVNPPTSLITTPAAYSSMVIILPLTLTLLQASRINPWVDKHLFY